MNTPPLARRESVVDILHGVPVADPYRWLEDGDDPEVQAWVAAQNAVTRLALDALPSRGEWHERLVALMDLPVVLSAELAGDRVVLLERQPGEQQARLTVRSLGAPGAGAVVLRDPAEAAADAAVAIDWFAVSPDGSLVAYGVSEGGTEDSVLHVARTADGSHLDEAIPGTRAASVAWAPDSASFHYTRYPDGDQYHRTVHAHRIGAPADGSADPVVWAEHPTPEAWPSVTASPGGRWLLVTVSVGWSRSDVHLHDLHDGSWHTLVAGADVVATFAFAGDQTLVGTTTHDAPKGRVVTIDLTGELPAGPDQWATVVPEGDAVLGPPHVAGDHLLLVASRAGVDRVVRYSLTGEGPADVSLPPVAGVAGVDTDARTGDAIAVVMGFGEPPGVWQIRADGGADRVHPVLDAGLIPELAVHHVEYPSKDGTSIGMFVIHRADVEPDAATATILNGYGGFAIAETPVWSPLIGAWCAAGNQYAIAQLRGGLEHGEGWHQAGWRGNKQNVFDDFAAAGDWLVGTGRTSRERLAIAGGSNGGLLVGATITQRPDLCRAAWCAVPLLDMVRFPQFLIARLWTHEYGDPDDPEGFGWLYAYSPYHHVVPGTVYPAVLLTTAEGDTRVDPLHARKMAALLQAEAGNGPDRPILLHQEARAGHGQGKPVGKRAAEYADVLAFLEWQLA